MLLGLTLSAGATLTTAVANNTASDTTSHIDCAAQLPVESGTIERITDGDTVVLRDQRRVRLIGINTPELNEPDQHLRQSARKAKRALEALLPKNETVLLYVGRESEDRHKRLLAHVVRKADHLAVAHHLLAQGHAMHIAVAPNTVCAEQFATLETTARHQGRGLWQTGSPVSRQAKNIDKDTRGFNLITGTVTDVQIKMRETQLTLDNQFVVLLRKALANQMNKRGTLDKLLGKKVEVRGWLSKRKNKPRLRLQHRANLRQLAY